MIEDFDPRDPNEILREIQDREASWFERLERTARELEYSSLADRTRELAEFQGRKAESGHVHDQQG